MGQTQIQSDSCTYKRKLLQTVFHGISATTKIPKQLKSSSHLKTIGFLSSFIFLSFAITQFSLVQMLKCSSEDSVYNSFHSTARISDKVDTNKEYLCNCDNNSNASVSKQTAKLLVSSHAKAEPTHTSLMSNSMTKENYSIKKQLEISESIWKRSVAQRHAWIATIAGNNLSSVKPWDGENYVFFWNYFSPSFNCPHSVQRVGFIGDGGKWVCGLELYETTQLKKETTTQNNRSEGMSSSSTETNPSCIIYSFGVANESSFEAETLDRTNCKVFAYDYSVKSIGSPVKPSDPRVTFKALGIGNKNLGKLRTLKHFMDQNGHDWIDILKMDIEGGEYSALDKIIADFTDDRKKTGIEKQVQSLPFGQLLLEVHVEEKIFPRFYEWWERLEANGLRAFWSEVNHVACGIAMVKPNFVEYSFINIRGNHRLLHT